MNDNNQNFNGMGGLQPLMGNPMPQQPMMDASGQQAMVNNPQSVMGAMPQQMAGIPQQPVVDDVQTIMSMQTQNTPMPQPQVQQPMPQPVQPMAQPMPQQPMMNPMPQAPGPIMDNNAQAYMNGMQVQQQQPPQLIDTPVQEEPKPKKKFPIKIVILILVALVLIGGIAFVLMAILNSGSKIDNTRAKNYAETANTYIKAAKNKFAKANAGDPELMYFLPVGSEDESSCFLLESGGQSPFNSTYKYAYVGLIFNQDNLSYDVYVSLKDGDDNVIEFAGESELNNNPLNNYKVNANYASGLESYYTDHDSTDIIDVEEFEDQDVVDFAKTHGAKYVKIYSVDECK